MKSIGRYTALIAAVAVACVVASCKKEKGTTSLPSLEGNLEYDSPVYVLPGDVLTLVPKGGKHPKDGDYGYYWVSSPRNILHKTDTTKRLNDPVSNDGRLVLTIPDTLCTFKLTASMFADGYTNIYAANDICIVKEESLTNIPALEGEKQFTDARDGKTYTYVTDGGLDWMNMNLRYAALGRPYENCAPMTDLFGNLYTYEQAEVSCPDGWRIPTMDEWELLCGGSFEGAAGSLMVDAYFNGNKMWEYWPDVNVTNRKKMNVYPTGYALVSPDLWKFNGTDEYAVYWTSSDYDEEQKCYISLYVDQPDVFYGNAHQDNFGASLRCVRTTTE